MNLPSPASMTPRSIYEAFGRCEETHIRNRCLAQARFRPMLIRDGFNEYVVLSASDYSNLFQKAQG